MNLQMNTTNNHKIILFDGVCNLCNNWVNFVIKRDNKDLFRFAALQSDAGLKLIERFKIDLEQTDSIILIVNDRHYIKSTAALKIAKDLNMKIQK